MPSLGLAASVNASAVSGITSAVAPLSFIGYQANTVADNYAVSNWSASTEKKFNVGAAEKYGTSGYYLLSPIEQTGGWTLSSFSQAVGAYNDLGISLASNTTLYSSPSFASVTGGSGTLVNFYGYTSFVNATADKLYRGGALSLNANQGPYSTPTQDMYFVDALYITLNQDADFVLGIATNTVNVGSYHPRYITVYTPRTGAVFSPLSPSTGVQIPVMPFFRIKGLANETFSVALWSETNGGIVTFSLVTFDRL
jgi:hypothetical protein